MSRAVIDQEFRITLPEELRKLEQFRPGAEVTVEVRGRTIHLSHVPPQRSSEEEATLQAQVRAIRGILPYDIDPTIEDDPEDNPWR